MKSKKTNPLSKRETIEETNQRLKQEAKNISENHVDVKPIKYLLKW